MNTRRLLPLIIIVISWMSKGLTTSSLYNQMPPRSVSSLFVVIIMFMLVPLGILIWVTVWVYNDAEKRGEVGVFWAMIVLFTNFIGLILYLIVRSENKQVMRKNDLYPNQNYQHQGDQNNQRNQGYQKPGFAESSNPTVYCSNCGAENSREGNFCNSCGAKLLK